MPKIITIIISFFFVLSQDAKPPSGYYYIAEGLTGDDLKTSLYQIIKGHTEYPYTSSSADTCDILKQTNKNPDNPDNVILFYTQVGLLMLLRNIIVVQAGTVNMFGQSPVVILAHQWEQEQMPIILDLVISASTVPVTWLNHDLTI